MHKPILEVRNVSKIYKTDRREFTALDTVSFDIYAGEIFSLLGINGAGKTTLSSLLATLHPISSGSIVYQGTSIYDDLYHYRTAIGFCPQKQNLDMFLNVQDNLLFAGRYFLLPEDIIHARMEQLLRDLNLTQYRMNSIYSLSGGTKQRVLIARALMHHPKIIILDEPTVGLDPDIRRKLWDLIATLKQQGITIILTTHYLDEAEVLSDRVCILHKGKILRLDSLKTLKEEHAMADLEEIFLKLTKV